MITKTLYKKAQELINRFTGKNQQKVFCIGMNKTGTTSLHKALSELGFIMGNQHTAELLLTDYAAKNWQPILNYCQTAQAFQDAPFSWPGTWQALVNEYPNAKYILTIRPEEDWYHSITTFHSKLFADGKRIPTTKDLATIEFKYPGYLLEFISAVWNTPHTDPYNKEILIATYTKHNNDVLTYFNKKPNFLCINVSNPNSYQKLTQFLKVKPLRQKFPHLNKT